MKVLCPEEKGFIEDILSKGFEVKYTECKYGIVVVFERETPLAKDRYLIESIYAKFYLNDCAVFETECVEYERGIQYEDGRFKTLKTQSFSSFSELLEEIEKLEYPVPA